MNNNTGTKSQDKSLNLANLTNNYLFHQKVAQACHDRQSSTQTRTQTESTCLTERTCSLVHDKIT